jgi:glycosyltransferase involved in cell wall biosynthesis
MRIGLLAPPLESVPPERYGGTERVVATLADALVARGHDVTLFASGDSRTSARLVPIVERAIWHDDRYEDLIPFWSIAAARAYANVDELDVMHNHMDFFAFAVARLAKVPTVTTLHGRLDMPELIELYREFSDQPVVSISNAQRRPIPHANWVGTVYHGYPLDLFQPSYATGSYLLFVGRMSPDKGLHVAIDIAIAADLPIKVAVRPPIAEHQHSSEAKRERDYFENEIRPRLSHPLVEYVGQASEGEKQDLYSGAIATLFPIDWPEPFGLVLIESLAAGTPVLASPQGAVPEVIADGVTGFHCGSMPEYLAALERVHQLDRRRCRREFERRFSADAMATAYEAVYERVALGLTAAAGGRGPDARSAGRGPDARSAGRAPRAEVEEPAEEPELASGAGP